VCQLTSCTLKQAPRGPVGCRDESQQCLAEYEVSSLGSILSGGGMLQGPWSQTYPLHPADHRIIECFGLEETFRDHLAHPPYNEQGHLQRDLVAQSPVQPDLGCFQGCGLHCLTGQPMPVFHHPHGKKFLAYIQSKSTLPYFKIITHCPVTTGLAKKIFSIFPIGPLRYWKAAIRSPRSLLFSRLNSPSSLSLSLQER